MVTKGAPSPPDQPLSLAALSALHRGDKIGAIKIMRAEQKLGLKEAKDLVEGHLQSHPALDSSFRTANRNAQPAGLFWLVVAIILATAIYYSLGK